MNVLHVVALPHTATTKEYLPCAYTQKVLNFCRMMTDQGWDVIHYGTEGSTVPCEHVDIISKAEQLDMFGENNFKKEFFKIEWDPTKPYWQRHNLKATQAIRERKSTGDFLCLIGGVCQRQIANLLPTMTCVEWGIGYEGTFAEFRVFESYAWMHSVLASNGNAYKANGRFYDEVIPNSFPVEDFSLGDGAGGYALYIGRLIQRKGVVTAALACEAAGMSLKIAGQGGEIVDGDLMFDGVTLKKGTFEYVGVVDVKERNKLMGGAIATLVPSNYLEPFGGVAVESQLCGTPAITTDFGAFTETVPHGVAGFRCHTLGEFVWALRACACLGPGRRSLIRKRAMKHYSLEATAPKYHRYFQRLADLRGKGWYTVKDFPEVSMLPCGS